MIESFRELMVKYYTCDKYSIKNEWSKSEIK